MDELDILSSNFYNIKYNVFIGAAASFQDFDFRGSLHLLWCDVVVVWCGVVVVWWWCGSGVVMVW